MKQILKEWGSTLVAAVLCAVAIYATTRPAPVQWIETPRLTVEPKIPEGVAVVHSGGKATLADHSHLDVRECEGCDKRRFALSEQAALSVLVKLGKARVGRDGAVAWVGS